MAHKPGTKILLALARIRKDCDKVEEVVRRRKALIAAKQIASRRRSQRA